MTTEAERKIIYQVYQHCQTLYKAVQEEYSRKYYGPNVGFGLYDDDEYRKAELQHHGDMRYLTARMDAANELWNFYKSLYNQWDIEMAIQEGEGRIGDMSYVDEPT